MPTKMTEIENIDGEKFMVPESRRFTVGACQCSANCGNVNLVLENDENEPVAVAQFSWQQVLDSFVEAAIEARDKQGGDGVKFN